MNSCACTGHNLPLRVISAVIFCKHCSGSAAASAATSSTAEHLAFRYSSQLTFTFPHWGLYYLLSISNELMSLYANQCNQNNARERNVNMDPKISKSKTKLINFPVTASTIQMRGWHSPQKAAAGPATAASRRRARSQAEVRILCILSTECWGWGEAEVRTVSASWPAHPATQQHRWLVAILPLILRTRQCPSCATHTQ